MWVCIFSTNDKSLDGSLHSKHFWRYVIALSPTYRPPQSSKTDGIMNVIFKRKKNKLINKKMGRSIRWSFHVPERKVCCIFVIGHLVLDRYHSLLSIVLYLNILVLVVVISLISLIWFFFFVCTMVLWFTYPNLYYKSNKQEKRVFCSIFYLLLNTQKDDAQRFYSEIYILWTNILITLHSR